MSTNGRVTMKQRGKGKPVMHHLRENGETRKRRETGVHAAMKARERKSERSGLWARESQSRFAPFGNKETERARLRRMLADIGKSKQKDFSSIHVDREIGTRLRAEEKFTPQNHSAFLFLDGRKRKGNREQRKRRRAETEKITINETEGIDKREGLRGLNNAENF